MKCVEKGVCASQYSEALLCQGNEIIVKRLERGHLPDSALGAGASAKSVTS